MLNFLFRSSAKVGVTCAGILETARVVRVIELIASLTTLGPPALLVLSWSWSWSCLVLVLSCLGLVLSWSLSCLGLGFVLVLSWSCLGIVLVLSSPCLGLVLV
jgi:hypothetical protein